MGFLLFINAIELLGPSLNMRDYVVACERRDKEDPRMGLPRRDDGIDHNK